MVIPHCVRHYVAGANARYLNYSFSNYLTLLFSHDNMIMSQERKLNQRREFSMLFIYENYKNLDREDVMNHLRFNNELGKVMEINNSTKIPHSKYLLEIYEESTNYVTELRSYIRDIILALGYSEEQLLIFSFAFSGEIRNEEKPSALYSEIWAKLGIIDTIIPQLVQEFDEMSDERADKLNVKELLSKSTSPLHLAQLVEEEARKTMQELDTYIANKLETLLQPLKVTR